MFGCAVQCLVYCTVCKVLKRAQQALLVFSPASRCVSWRFFEACEHVFSGVRWNLMTNIRAAGVIAISPSIGILLKIQTDLSSIAGTLSDLDFRFLSVLLIAYFALKITWILLCNFGNKHSLWILSSQPFFLMAGLQRFLFWSLLENYFACYLRLWRIRCWYENCWVGVTLNFVLLYIRPPLNNTQWCGDYAEDKQ